VSIPEWINEGQKFALLCLQVDWPRSLPERVFGNGIRIQRRLGFAIPDHWKSWIGTIRSDKIVGSNLFAVSVQDATDPDVLNAENHSLRLMMERLYPSLMLSGFTSVLDDPVILTGSFARQSLDVRQLSQPRKPANVGYYRIARQNSIDFRIAENIYNALESVDHEIRYREVSVLSTYFSARSTEYMVERIHQYLRVIEALLIPRIGRTKRDIRSRIELLVGEGYGDMFDEIFDIRSNVEHMNEFVFEDADRHARLRHMELDIIMENLARESLKKILLNQELRRIFFSRDRVRAFWEMNADERREIWGAPFDPTNVMRDYPFDIIPDNSLGIR
jgi:hypothetical protein